MKIHQQIEVIDRPIQNVFIRSGILTLDVGDKLDICDISDVEGITVDDTGRCYVRSRLAYTWLTSGRVKVVDPESTTEQKTSYFDIVFADINGPEEGKFDDIESPEGKSIKIGQWVTRADGWRVLRINRQEILDATV